MIKLREYQQNILNHLKYVPSIGIFSGTGSGKTFMALSRSLENGTSNLLVFCPSKVTKQWEENIKEHYPNYKVVEFPKSYNSAKKADIIVDVLANNPKGNAIVLSLESCATSIKTLDSRGKTSKRLVFEQLKTLVNNDWTIIVDESHKIKELGTRKSPVQVTNFILNLKDTTPYKILLTATPTQKAFGGYIDYYTQLYFLGYLDYTIQGFKGRYCLMEKIQPVGTPYPIQIIKGYQNITEIDNLLKLCCVRYVPKITDFDPQHIKVKIDKPKSYAKLTRENFYEDLDMTSLSQRRIARMSVCTGTVIGRDIYSETKWYADNENKIEWLKELIENTDEKIVIFYSLNAELHALKELCEQLHKKVIVINGEASSEEKYDRVNNQEFDICLGQFKACGESIDGLQYKSHICVYFALPESSVVYQQALGRINRIGQEFMPIYYYLCCENTIEDKIWDMLQDKIEFQEETLNKLVLEEC